MKHTHAHTQSDTGSRTRKILASSYGAFLALFAGSTALFFAAGNAVAGAAAGAAAGGASVAGNAGEQVGAISGWIARNRFMLEASNELVCFAMVALAIFLCFAFPRARKAGSALGTTALAVLAITIPAMTAMLVAQGRMAYPIAGLVPDEGINAFLLSAYLGCQHILFLAFAALAFMGAFGGRLPAWFRIVSVPAGAAFVAGAYSWLLPQAFCFAATALFFAYGIGAGFAFRNGK